MFATLFYTRQVYSLHFPRPPSFKIIFTGDFETTWLYYTLLIIRSKKMMDTLCEIKALLMLWSIQELLLEIITFNGAHTLT